MKRFRMGCVALLAVSVSALAGAVELAPDFAWPTRYEGRTWGRLLRSTTVEVVDGERVYRNHQSVTSLTGDVLAVTRNGQLELSFAGQTPRLAGATAVIAVDGPLQRRGGRGRVFIGAGSVATSARGVSDVEPVRIVAQLVGTGARQRVVGRLISLPVAGPGGARHDADLVVVRFSATMARDQWL